MKKSARKLKVGFDFDGVVAYNPLRVLRLPLNSLKKLLLQENRLNFYIPKRKLDRFVWSLAHEFSYFPAIGFSDLKKLLKKHKIEAYLITARYAFLEKSFFQWLKRHRLDKDFKGYFFNAKNEQPHKFKERMVKKLDLDVFVDDNLDIVKHLNKTTKAEIHWIYNVIDRFNPYRRKHPYLKKFLETLSSSL